MRARRVDGGVGQRPAVSVRGAQPVLPSDEDLGERLRREVEVDDVDVLGGERREGQRGRHTEVAATAAAQRPEQVGVAGRGCGDRLAVGQHHRRRCQLVAEQTRMPGLGAQAAAQRVPRGADRWAGTRRDAPAGRGKRPVHRVEAGGRRHRDLPRGRVVVGVPGQLAQIEHHGPVGGRRSYVGVPATARSDLEVVGGGERHRLLHVGRRRGGDDGRRRGAVVVGVENLFGTGELGAVREQHLAAERGGKAFPPGRPGIGESAG